MYPPFSGPGSREIALKRRQTALPSIEEFLDELPPIEDFIDSRSPDSPTGEAFGGEELPSIERFTLDEGQGSQQSEHEHAGDWFDQGGFDAEGWAVAGWQSFDWSGAASLGVRPEERSEATSAWDTLDWSAAPLSQQAPGSSRQKDAPPSADEVARALDGIAQRIRSGELIINQDSGTPPEAAMAAALAALLRKRD